MTGALESHQPGGARPQALEPAQLVVEFRAGRRVAVRKVEAGHRHAVDVGFEISAVQVLRIAGQAAARLHGHHAAPQDGDAVPALLAVPNRAIARIGERSLRKSLLRGLQLLKTDGVGP